MSINDPLPIEESVPVIVARAFVKGWRLVAISTVIAVAIAAAFALTAPNQYTARVVALPQEALGGASPLGQFAAMSDMAALAGVSMPKSGSANEILAILNSRTLQQVVIEECALGSTYSSPSVEERCEGFSRDFIVSLDKRTNCIFIAYTHRDPTTAARVANTAAARLQVMYTDFQQGSSTRIRTFLEGRLADATQRRSSANDRLVKFQGEHRLVEISAQTRSTVEAMGQLQGQLLAQKVELTAQMSTQIGIENPQAQLARVRIQELEKAIAAIGGGDGGPAAIFLPVGGIPGLAVQYVDLLREVKKYETIVDALAAQVESARLREHQTADAITIVDPAFVPERKSRPRRAAMIIAGLVCGLVMGAALSAMHRPILNWWKNNRSAILE